MCGIGGSVGAAPDRGVLERMADTMAARGPDGRAVWTGDGVGFAFRRLAIIDLHERSDQPMHFEGRHLVFNGEIYNYIELRDELKRLGHTFVTEGDAEVLLHAWAEWGEGALERLNGMFAFALWDERDRSLALAVDPFGEKPLYYHEAAGRLVFASEIKALLEDPAVPRSPDDAVVGAYLAIEQAMPRSAETFVGAIRRVPAAHLLRWRDGRVAIERYWRPARVAVPDDQRSAAEALRALLEDSIRLRLRSDVPVGTSLSGGVDSSAIVGLAATIAGDHRRHAFTARFPGFERDEWAFAEATARSAHVLEHHAVEPTADEMLADLAALVECQGEPVGSTSIYAQYRVMQAAHEAGVTVLLDGQGADELFGGYPGVSGWALRSIGPGAALASAARDRAQRGEVVRSWAADHAPRFVARAYRRRAASPYAARELVGPGARKAEPPPSDRSPARSPLERQLALQAFDTSLPHLLRYADHNSMGHSREVRLPFLDRRIAEFAFSLPAAMLYRDGVTKRVLRDAVRDCVPPEVLERRDKVGFETPQTRWLGEGAVRDRIAEVLLDPSARVRGLYDAAAVEADLRAGAWRSSAGIWRALNLELWLRGLSSWGAS